MSSSLRQPLSKVDTAWLHMDSPTNLMMVTSILLFDEPVDVARVRRLLDARLLRFDRFRQRIVTPWRSLHEPQWELDPDFDLDMHLHHVALPAPGGDAELQDLVGDLMSTPLDRSHPLWSLHLVDGYGAGSAAVFRSHHCVADGIALTRVLLSLMDTEPGGGDGELPLWRSRPPAARVVRRGRLDGAAHLAGVLVDEGLRAARNPERVLNAVRLGAGGVLAFLRVLTLPADPGTALKGPLGARKRPAWSKPIPLDDVKAIGRLVDATVNDVLVTAAAGALRRYMLRRGDDADAVEIHATVPVNLRRPAADISLGNRFGLVYPAVPVHIADPMLRLRAVKEEMDGIKSTPEALMAIGILDLLGRTPVTVEHAALDLFTSKSSVMITNVPGPRVVQVMAGVPLRRVLVWAPTSGGLAMSVSILSYHGEVTVGVASDAGLVPDPESVVAAFHEELDALAEAGRRRTAARLARRARRPAARSAPRRRTQRSPRPLGGAV